MRKIVVILVAFVMVFGLASCRTKEKNEDIYAVYTLAVSANQTDLTYEQWLETVRGPEGLPGEDGKDVFLRVDSDYIQWQNDGDSSWHNLLSLDTISGTDGKEVAFLQNDGIMYWQYVGEESWRQLFSINELIEYSIDAYYVNTIPESVTMENLDSLLGRKDIQYVDLREYGSKWMYGYIQGFEVVPFQGILERYDVLKRTDGWVFEFGAIKDQATLVEIFDINKSIFLMCDDGNKSLFVKDALDAIGYQNVYVIGKYQDYHGSFNSKTSIENKFDFQPPLPDEIYMDSIDDYLSRQDVQYFDLRNWDDALKDGKISGFEVLPYFDYLEVELIISGRADSVVLNQARVEQLFDRDAHAILLMCASGGRAGWVKQALEAIGYTNVYNIGGFKDYEGENKVVGDGTFIFPPE